MSVAFAQVSVKVWSEWGCFTRPEAKVERVSYPVMTPSAARGILESIMWKPEMQYVITEIQVLKPIQYFSILRNEINTRASERAARGWETTGGGYDAAADRAQRHTLALRNVAYIIHARISVRPGVDEPVEKYTSMFQRRVRTGRCYTTPYLGTREFSAYFAPPDGTERPVDVSDDIGQMLLDLDYATDGSGRGTPRFFKAELKHGILRPPAMPVGER
jgi:CRISPR-associated protein Cas5d